MTCRCVGKKEGGGVEGRGGPHQVHEEAAARGAPAPPVSERHRPAPRHHSQDAGPDHARMLGWWQLSEQDHMQRRCGTAVWDRVPLPLIRKGLGWHETEAWANSVLEDCFSGIWNGHSNSRRHMGQHSCSGPRATQAARDAAPGARSRPPQPPAAPQPQGPSRSPLSAPNMIFP